jgi:hypothetical protein
VSPPPLEEAAGAESDSTSDSDADEPAASCDPFDDPSFFDADDDDGDVAVPRPPGQPLTDAPEDAADVAPPSEPDDALVEKVVASPRPPSEPVVAMLPPSPAGLAAGRALAGGWIVERSLDVDDELIVALATGEGGGRALCFAVPAGAPDPDISAEKAAHWGTVRRVLRDQELGRIVIDELPEGDLIADREESGLQLRTGVVEEIGRVVREAHRRGWAHGQLGAQCIVVSPHGLSVAGWELAVVDAAEARARDLAALAALSGAATPGTTTGGHAATGTATPSGDEPTGAAAPAGEAVMRLHAAMRSESVQALREALETYDAGGGDPSVSDVVRARDALARLEGRIQQKLDHARAMIAAGDTLGAQAACREAIRLGAEEEAQPLLAEARRSTRQQLSSGRRVSPRVLITGAVGLVALALLIAALVAGFGEDPTTSSLRDQVETIASQQGSREAVRHLLGLRSAGADQAVVGDLLAERFEVLRAEERERLLGLRNAVVAQGARPLEADAASQAALQELDALTPSEVAGDPTFGVRLENLLAALDRAASMYRSATVITVDEAATAVENLLSQDPLFSRGARR